MTKFWKTQELGKHIDARCNDWSKSVEYREYTCWWTVGPSGNPVGGIQHGYCKSDSPMFPTKKAAKLWLEQRTP